MKRLLQKSSELVQKNKLYVTHLVSTYLLMFVNYLLVFFLTPYTLRYLGEEQYGIWALLSSVISYFNLSNLGLNSTLLVELPKVKGNAIEYNKLINTIFFSLAAMSLASTVIIAGLYAGFDHLFKIDPEYVDPAKLTLLVVYATFILSFVGSTFDNILYSTNNIHRKNFLEIGKYVFIGLSSFSVLHFGYGLIAVALCHLFVTYFYYYAVFASAKKLQYFKLNFNSFDFVLLKKVMNPSWHYFIVGLASQIVFFSDNLLISALKGVEFVAMYTIMYRLCDVSMKLLFKVSDVKYPKITHLSNDRKYVELLHLHNRLLIITATSVTVLFCIIFFWGVDILHLWLGDKVKLDENILRVFSLFMVVHSCVHVPSLFIMGMKIHKRSAYVALVDAALNLILSFWLFHYFDLLGIALGTLISNTVTGGWFVFYEFYTFIKKKIEAEKLPLLIRD